MDRLDIQRIFVARDGAQVVFRKLRIDNCLVREIARQEGGARKERENAPLRHFFPQQDSEENNRCYDDNKSAGDRDEDNLDQSLS
jgi:hypothetical protein